MKNATLYEKKIRKMLSSMSRKAQPQAPQGLDAFGLLIEAILQADVPRKAAAGVIEELRAEFVDYNELRVAPVKDITDCMPREFWSAREKAEGLIRSLNAIFDRTCSMSMQHLEKMPKRELRKYLAEIGLSQYAVALVTMLIFGGHAIPVDQSLVDALEMEKLIAPRSDLADVQGFLERIIAQKDDYAAHEFFRDFVEKNYKALAKKRKESAAARPPAAVKETVRPQEESFQEVLSEPDEPHAARRQPAAAAGKPALAAGPARKARASHARKPVKGKKGPSKK